MAEISADLVDQASRLNRAALEQILEAHYPAVHRIAHGISGREDIGKAVVRYVMKRSLRAAPHWTLDSAPTRWFFHHTILSLRRTNAAPPDPMEDLLGRYAPQPVEAGYVAFLRAIRTLPRQQAEALLLHHAEKLDIRGVSTSMDLSTDASTNHLCAAETTLRTITTPHDFKRYMETLRGAYLRLSPEMQVVVPEIRQQYRRFIWPRMIARTIGWIFLMASFSAIAWLAWNWKDVLEF